MRQHLDQAAEAIRAANHATSRGPLAATDAYGVVGDLTLITGRLPQLLDYLVRSLHRADPADHYDDRGTDPTDALAMAQGYLDDARHDAAELTEHLNHAHNHLSHIGYRVPED